MKKKNFPTFILRTSVIVAVVFLLYGCIALSKSVVAENANRRGAAAYDAGDYPLAEVYFESAVSVNPKYSSAWLNLARVAAERAEYELAISAYNNVLEHSANPENIRLARIGLVNIYNNNSIEEPIRRKSWYEEAAGHLDILIDEFPENPEYRLYLGFAFFNAADPGAGMEQLFLASELANTSEELWVHEELQRFYYQINLMDNAEKERRIIEGAKYLTPDNHTIAGG